jgi:hypothetical protein
MRAALVLVGVLGFIAPAAAQITPDTTLYVEEGDFGTAIVAAIHKKKVPIRVTRDQAAAALTLAETSSQSQEGAAVRVTKILAFGGLAGNGRTVEASVMLTNREGDVLFAYNVKKNNVQSAAEAVAKHLGNYIKDTNKKRK